MIEATNALSKITKTKLIRESPGNFGGRMAYKSRLWRCAAEEMAEVTGPETTERCGPYLFEVEGYDYDGSGSLRALFIKFVQRAHTLTDVLAEREYFEIAGNIHYHGGNSGDLTGESCLHVCGDILAFLKDREIFPYHPDLMLHTAYMLKRDMAELQLENIPGRAQRKAARAWGVNAPIVSRL